MNKKIFFRIKAIAELLKKEYKAEQVMEQEKIISKVKSAIKLIDPQAKVILFGSYARGDETKDSDLDLLIIAPTREGFFQRMAHVRKLIRNLRKGLPFAPIILNKKELVKRINIGDQFIKEILETGIRL